MQGYCAVSIGHLDLCKFLDEDESTWVGIRDIGPAAFDKRIEGYKSIYIAAENKFDNTVSDYRTGDIEPQTFIPMTSVDQNYEGSLLWYRFKHLAKKIYNKLKVKD